ncbi:MAG: hypothetical protein L3J38_06815 [Thiomicrorhabdus sp.]|nr:hypothetical protein [Thiomicrorhabdus sp.]MCF6299119.1 hypothetical protein [Thiomicrorhabdus sp.]
MKETLLTREVLPFLLVFIALIGLAILIDAILHLLGLEWIGRWLGVVGTMLILLSLLYSMRKHKKIHFGEPKTLLKLHELLTLSGALLILLHAGIHFYSILPWLALAAMMISVISGMTGRYLLNRSRRFVAEKREELTQQAHTAEDEIELFREAVTVDLMKKWRSVHLPITFMFAVLSLAHILTILMYWEWK